MKNNKRPTKDQFQHYLHILRHNAPLFIGIFLVAIYGFLSWRIFALMQAEPSDSQVSSQLQTIGVPKVDPDVVSKINKLEDNSVSVQTLFDQARQNPFNE